MSRAQWFFLVALAAAAAVVFFKPRPSPRPASVTTAFTLPEAGAAARTLPPAAQTGGVSSTGGLRTTAVKKKNRVP